MDKIRNKIIALSGQPVTGKGTTTKALIEKLKEDGYKAENIHVISTGNEFRRYFNILIDFIRNLNNDEKIKELSETKEMKDIMSSLERRLHFINTISKIKNSDIDLENFSIEQANNLDELKEIRSIIDTLIDEGIKKKGIEINSVNNPDEIWIVDSRLAFSNIPDAFSVRLTATPEVAAKRLFNDSTRGKEDSSYKSLEEAKTAREKRRLGEQERYKQRYGVDLEDPNNYDLIIDTSFASIDDTADVILDCLEHYVDNKPIEVVEASGYKGIIEGHHRNFACAILGKTLIPYEVIAKDDEKIPYGGGTARQRIDSLNLTNLFDHEVLFEKNGEKFSYNSVYPGIYNRLREKEGSIR